MSSVCLGGFPHHRSVHKALHSEAPMLIMATHCCTSVLSKQGFREAIGMCIFEINQSITWIKSSLSALAGSEQPWSWDTHGGAGCLWCF